jgi:hypothetical protein
MPSNAERSRAWRRAPLLASAAVSSVASAPEGAAPGAGPAPSRSRFLPLKPSLDSVIGLILAAGAVALAVTTSAGLDPIAGAGDTWSEIVITLLGGFACGAVIVFAARERVWGGATIGLFAALTVFTAGSIVWSVAPEDSWQSAGQTLAYLAAFASAAGLARLAPRRWPAVVGAVVTAATALSGYALLAKALPATFDPGDELGRLQVPFGYWNAVGVTAALGLAPCLWAGARAGGGRAGRGRVLRAMSAPATAVLISVVVLSYSRSAVLVAVLAVGAWLAFVPLRLRAAALLALGAAGAAVITGWALSTRALTADRIPEAARISAGHSFGLVLLATLLVLCAAGVAYAVALERLRLPPATRRRFGTVLVVIAALLPLAGIGALAASSRGLTGEISHVWDSLTITGGSGHVVGDNASRLLQLGNSRPLYWSEGITVGEHALLKGAGAGGFATARTAYTSNGLPVSHAHSYVIQTFADLGLIGVAISLALLVSWGLAAARPLALPSPWRSLTEDRAAERHGMITLAIVVVAFGVQSAVDWTWSFAGVAIPALVCAGWLAGRGPLAVPVGAAAARRPILQRPAAGALVTALAAVTFLGAWGTWQPLRSANALSASLNAAAAGNTGQAFTDAREAATIDPVTIEPLQILASLYTAVHDPAAARNELVQATRRQPDNPRPWLWLGQFDVGRHHPRRAFGSLQRALRLDRSDRLTIDLVIQVRNQLGIPQPKP